MSSKTGSTTPLPEVKRVAVVTHGRAETSGETLERLRAVAEERGIELLLRTRKPPSTATAAAATSRAPTLRSCSAATGRCCGRCGGSSAPGARARRQSRASRLSGVDRGGRARGGRPRAPSPASSSSSSCPRWRPRPEASAGSAVNDVVVASSTIGRMIELGWAIGGEDLGSQPCDGLICSTPSGSTAYNLSNGGPVLVWGLDAMAITFVAPHSLHARPLVVPRGRDAGRRRTERRT